MVLYIPHSIFHLARLLSVRSETFGPYHVDRTLWRTDSGRGNGPITRQATELINECLMRLPAANGHHRRETTRTPTGPIKICELHRSVPFEVTCKEFLKLNIFFVVFTFDKSENFERGFS